MRVSRRGAVDPFIVMDILAEARRAEARGVDIVHMEIGQPGASAPQTAREALTRAMAAGPLGYTEGTGLPALRARIARAYGDWYNLDLNPERVVVTNGSSGAFQLAFISLFDTGARVGIGDPGYPSYRSILKALALEPVRLETGPETRFQPVPEHLIGEDLDGLLVASPANPTGTMLGRADLADLVDACARQGIALISDEIYHHIDYGKRATSALELTDNVYVINSFSKFFCMTGWRVGWMIVPEDHVRQVDRLSQNLFICAPHASQVAALAAFDSGAELAGHIETYTANRQLLLDELPRAGFSKIAPPDGAFYIYADVSDLTDNSMQLARDLLKEARVAATPGIDFDPVRGHRFLRFSYAGNHERMQEGVRRLKAWYQARVAHRR